VPPEQPRHCLSDDRTLEEIGLHPALGAKRTQSDEGCVGDKRTQLDAEREIGYRKEKKEAGKHADDDWDPKCWAI
jgi:hypothetical protein